MAPKMVQLHLTLRLEVHSGPERDVKAYERPHSMAASGEMDFSAAAALHSAFDSFASEIGPSSTWTCRCGRAACGLAMTRALTWRADKVVVAHMAPHCGGPECAYGAKREMVDAEDSWYRSMAGGGRPAVEATLAIRARRSMPHAGGGPDPDDAVAVLDTCNVSLYGDYFWKDDAGKRAVLFELSSRAALFSEDPRLPLTCVLCSRSAAHGSAADRSLVECVETGRQGRRRTFAATIWPTCGPDGPCHAAVRRAYLKKITSGDDAELVCTYCERSSPKAEMRRCSRCRAAHYCGRECQRKDWPKHKAACEVPSKPSAGGTSTSA
ncbi:hypothetical protein DFJ74DRAFT_692109 [Hyaloraphidium curvatum]|nr:hypothetical protein DFJ74DRAFT_692109 [Hyaloraphidium curvatum]